MMKNWDYQARCTILLAWAKQKAQLTRRDEYALASWILFSVTFVA